MGGLIVRTDDERVYENARLAFYCFFFEK